MPDKLKEILDEAGTKTATAQKERIPETDLIHEGREKKKKNNFLKSVIPWKGDAPLELVRKSVFIVSFVVAIICFSIIIQRAGVSLQAEKQHEGLRDLVGSQGDPTRGGTINITDEEIDLIRSDVPGILDQYIALYGENSDLVGWIEIEGTKVNYPVLQYRRLTADGTWWGNNNYYLYTDFHGKTTDYGSIYADWTFPITPTSRPNNTILYGHNIRDGSMFARAARFYPKYSDPPSISAYKSNPVIRFDTIYEPGLYKVFAAIYVHTDEDKYDDVFDYFRWREFPDKETFLTFVTHVLDRSGFYTDVDLRYGDEIITLSTCYYPLGTSLSSRVAVFARRVREGEDPEVNTDLAYINPSPLYFKEYYRQRGGSWDGRNWDTSKVEGLDEFLAEKEAKGEELPLLFSQLHPPAEPNAAANDINVE